MLKILIINTDKKTSIWSEYLSELSANTFSFFILSNNPASLAWSKSKNYPHQKYFNKLNFLTNSFTLVFFYLLRPLSFIYALLFLSYYKFSKKINILLLFSIYEQLYFTRIGRLLGLRVFWGINPEQILPANKLLQKKLIRLSRKSTTICIGQQSSKQLQKINWLNIKTITPGINNKKYSQQKNIFDSLAKNNLLNKSPKFFTIGTIADLNKNITHLEKLLQAIKQSVEFIPQLQLIIAGDGVNKKKITWLTKKMNIANLVWLVGNHHNPQKWLSNFDLYITTSPHPSLIDIHTVLLASFDSLAVIAPQNTAFADIIHDQHTGLLINTNHSKEFANAIINLQQNPNKRKNLGKNGQNLIIKNFGLNQTIQQLTDILQA